MAVRLLARGVAWASMVTACEIARLDRCRRSVEDARMPVPVVPDPTSPATQIPAAPSATDASASDGSADVERERAIQQAIDALAGLGVLPAEVARRLQRAWIANLEPADVIVRIDGKRHYCSCGVGVFRKPRAQPLVFVCNGCGDVWKGMP